MMMPAEPVPGPDKPADASAAEPPTPPQPPSTALAIGFAIPAMLSLLGGLSVVIAWSKGFPFSDVWVLVIFGSALVALTVCFFFALEGLGYAVRCPLRWPYKVLLLMAHLLALGSSILVPAGVGLANRADQAIYVEQIKAQAIPLRRVLVDFYTAQGRFPLPHEWAMMHPRDPQAAPLPQVLPTYDYRTQGGYNYELTYYRDRELVMSFVFDPFGGSWGGLGWRVETNDSGQYFPVDPAPPLPGEAAVFAAVKARRVP